MKVSELKGTRNLLRIECSCSGLAVWLSRGNKKFDQKERAKFLKEHGNHEVSRFQVSSAVSRS